MATKKTGSCVECGREKVLEARGLCCGCYGRWKRYRKKPGAPPGRTKKAATKAAMKAATKGEQACASCERMRPLVARGLCSTCYARDRRQRRAAEITAPAVAASAAVAPPARVGDSVVLDFSGAPDLRRELEAKAQREFRSLEMQILWELKGTV